MRDQEDADDDDADTDDANVAVWSAECACGKEYVEAKKKHKLYCPLVRVGVWLLSAVPSSPPPLTDKTVTGFGWCQHVHHLQTTANVESQL
jgi:hypothetical protein